MDDHCNEFVIIINISKEEMRMRMRMRTRTRTRTRTMYPWKNERITFPSEEIGKQRVDWVMFVHVYPPIPQLLGTDKNEPRSNLTSPIQLENLRLCYC